MDLHIWNKFIKYKNVCASSSKNMKGCSYFAKLYIMKLRKDLSSVSIIKLGRMSEDFSEVANINLIKS